jgi:hypothetical protein
LIFCSLKKSFSSSNIAHLVAFPFRDLPNKTYLNIFTSPGPGANITLWASFEVPVLPCNLVEERILLSTLLIPHLVRSHLLPFLQSSYAAWICAGILSWNIIDAIRIAEGITSSSTMLYGALQFATSSKIVYRAGRHLM